MEHNCKPFEPIFSSLVVQEDDIACSIKNESVRKDEKDRAKLIKNLKTLHTHILKPIENLYKKYLVNDTVVTCKITTYKQDCFSSECVANYVCDIETFDLQSINKLLGRMLDKISTLIYDKNIEFMSEIINKFKSIKSYIDLFEMFVTKW